MLFPTNDLSSSQPAINPFFRGHPTATLANDNCPLCNQVIQPGLAGRISTYSRSLDWSQYTVKELLNKIQVFRAMRSFQQKAGTTSRLLVEVDEKMVMHGECFFKQLDEIESLV